MRDEPIQGEPKPKDTFMSLLLLVVLLLILFGALPVYPYSRNNCATCITIVTGYEAE